MPTEYQKQWAAFLMEQGVDVVIGGHPHVLQPYGRMSDDNGNEMLIFYSLGNFVSTQQELPELLEGMAGFTIQKSVLKGKTTVEILDATVKPMVMHYNKDEGVFSHICWKTTPKIWHLSTECGTSSVMNSPWIISEKNSMRSCP